MPRIGSLTGSFVAGIINAVIGAIILLPVIAPFRPSSMAPPPVVTEIGILLLWLSAILTLYTGWDYMRAGLQYMVDE